jgi:tetratricopeptide (TPR) repeat protein
MNDFGIAEKYFEESLSYYRKNQVKYPKEYQIIAALTQNYLGVAQLGQLKYDKAEVNFEQALRDREMLALMDKSQMGYLVQTITNMLSCYQYKAPRQPIYARKGLKLIAKARRLMDNNKDMSVAIVQQSKANIEATAPVFSLQATIELNKLQPSLRKIEALIISTGKIEKIENKISILEKANDLAVKTLKEYPEHDSIVEYQGTIWGSLSFDYILINKPDKAEAYALKALALNKSELNWVNTNLALALLIQNNRWEEAKATYDKWKKEPYDERYPTYKDVFLADLHEVQKRNIVHPNIQKAIDYLSNGIR